MLVHAMAEKNARLHPRKPAFVWDQGSVTFAAVDARANQLARALQGLGVKQGDRVATLLRDCHQQAEIYFATAKIGAVVVPLNIRLSGREMAGILNNAAPGVLLVGTEFSPLIDTIRPHLQTVAAYIDVSEAARPGYLAYEPLCAAEPVRPPVVEAALRDEDPFALLYTGGTTGLPKGAVITHRNVIANSVNMALCMRLMVEDVTMQVTPMFHAGGLIHLTSHYYMGITTVLPGKSEPQILARTIDRYRITTSEILPTLIKGIATLPDRGEYDLSSVRCILHGGEPMYVEWLRDAFAAFPNSNFVESYALTEAYALVTYFAKDRSVLAGSDRDLARLGSAGREVFNMVMRVVDDEDRDVPVGEVGEIVARGDCVMQCYWQNPAETERALRNGWLHTGDLGRLDEDGYLFVVDRKKDMIISGGEKIYPREVEEVINAHPAVQRVAVFGVPDPRWGETVKAMILLKPGASLTAEEVVALCREHLGGFKRPRVIEFVDAFPTSAIGKVLKRELRQQA